MEFLRWRLILIQEQKEAFEKEWKNNSKQDWNFAQVCYSLYRIEKVISEMFSGKDIRFDLDVKDFLLKFKFEKDSNEPERNDVYPEETSAIVGEMTPEEIAEKKAKISQAAQQVWAARMGVDFNAIPEQK